MCEGLLSFFKILGKFFCADPLFPNMGVRSCYRANQLSSERLELRVCEEKVANLRGPTAGCLGREEACARESLLTELKSEMIMSEAARSAALGRADLLSIPLARLQCVREDRCSVEASLA